jgi:hypothetical protein
MPRITHAMPAFAGMMMDDETTARLNWDQDQESL